MTSDKPKPIDFALKYAAHGFQVFPVYLFQDDETGKWLKRPPRTIVQGKKCQEHRDLRGDKGSKNDKAVKACPDCHGAHHVATTDPDEVRRLFAEIPTWDDTVVVVAAMPPPGVLVLDDDSSVFDPIWWDNPHVRTTSGKRHYYFRLGPGQEPIRSENLIQYGSESTDLVDVRCEGDSRWIVVPSGTSHYRSRNGWRIEPDTYPLCPDNVYNRLLTAPRRSGGGGGAGLGGKYAPGVSQLATNPYDYDGEAAEQLLADAGWTCDGGDRWTRPGGTDGFGRLNERDSVWFFNVHTDNDPLLRAGHFYTPSMLRCVFEHGGDWRTTYDQLIREATRRAFSKGTE